MELDADVLIAGGGLVGGGLACALDGLPLRVVQVDTPARPVDGAARDDERHFALARRTVDTLRRLGVWDACSEHAHPIANVHVSSRGDFGAVRVRAADYGLDALGRTLPASILAAAIEARVARCANLVRHVPATLVALHDDGDARVATIETPDGARRDLRARLVVGADGTGSFVRGAAGIGTTAHDYGQTAIVTSVVVARPEPEWAFERLTETGPFALLPQASERYGLVWATTTDDAATLLALDDDAFLAAAQARFGARLGPWRRVGRRQPWPLKLTRADALTAPRVALVGNAAQTIHPVGAQGFNLGMRDAVALRDHVAAAVAAGDDCGDAARLAAYAAARRDDRERTIALSDGLVRLFARTAWPLRVARSVAFAALDRLPHAKQDLAFTLMGYRADDVPRRDGEAPHAA